MLRSSIARLTLLALWTGQGLEDNLRAERHRIQRFEESAAGHVVNNLGLEIDHLSFDFDQQLSRLAETPKVDRYQAVTHYRSVAHESELLSDVLMVTEHRGRVSPCPLMSSEFPLICS